MLERLTLDRVDTPTGRHYVTPVGNLPSITTVLSSQDHSFLDEWRDRVGHKTADRISRAARNRGTEMHDAIEQLLIHGEFDDRRMFPVAKQLFRQIKPTVERIQPLLLEAPLYSKSLGIAGTVDCVGHIDGRLCIVDFKTARALKKEEWIADYFMQCCAYAAMVYECYNLIPKHCIIMIAVENEQQPQVFMCSPRDYMDDLKQVIEEYNRKSHV